MDTFITNLKRLRNSMQSYTLKKGFVSGIGVIVTLNLVTFLSQKVDSYVGIDYFFLKIALLGVGFHVLRELSRKTPKQVFSEHKQFLVDFWNKKSLQYGGSLLLYSSGLGFFVPLYQAGLQVPTIVHSSFHTCYRGILSKAVTDPQFRNILNIYNPMDQIGSLVFRMSAGQSRPFMRVFGRIDLATKDQTPMWQQGVADYPARILDIPGNYVKQLLAADADQPGTAQIQELKSGLVVMERLKKNFTTLLRPAKPGQNDFYFKDSGAKLEIKRHFFTPARSLTEHLASIRSKIDAFQVTATKIDILTFDVSGNALLVWERYEKVFTRPFASK